LNGEDCKQLRDSKQVVFETRDGEQFLIVPIGKEEEK